MGLTRAFDLFKISPFSDHVIGILLDTSTLNGSVHRVFSFHFASRRICIPITNPKTKDIYTKYENYETVLEETKSSFVLENLRKGNKEQYFQKPTIISMAQIRRILSPDAGLLPVIAMIVRFSERFVTERSFLSYKFWIEFFALTTCYDYISNKLLRINIQECDTAETFGEISKIVDNCSIELKLLVKEAIKNFLQGKVSYLVLKTKLDALKDFEFFFRLKSDAIKPISFEEFKDLIENTNMRNSSQLIRSFSKLFLMVQVWICYILDHLKFFESDAENRKKAINELFFRLQSFRELMEEKPVKLKGSKEKDKQFDLLYLILLHNIYTRFLKDFFLFKSRYGGNKMIRFSQGRKR